MPVIESTSLALFFWAAFGYLLGSIAFGILIARLMGLGNLREIGSGNIGATNVLRTGNKLAALLTVLLDGAKGAVAVLIAGNFAGLEAAQIAGLLAFVGHCFPVWLGFKGGKGVATFLGVLLALAWPLGIASCATWLVAAVLTRVSSLSALIAAAGSILWSVYMGLGTTIVVTAILAIMIFARHHENIGRIRAGKEPKIGAK